MKVTVGKAEYILAEGDSIYFNAALPHGQRAVDGSARFSTIIQELGK
jgi:quercetin dioxygenase-like cupin family protein